jgi:hypothetical protein
VAKMNESNKKSEKEESLWEGFGKLDKNSFQNLHSIIKHAKLTKAMKVTFNRSNLTKTLLNDSNHTKTYPHPPFHR